MGKYILSLDQGTTSSRAILFDINGNVEGMAQKEFRQIYPEQGWVEHDPMEILGSQTGVVKELIDKTSVNPCEIHALGITNQRETTIVWDKNTGKPIYNAIVWQCRRTADICDEIKNMGYEDYIREKTGLVVDAYFSGTKIKWILDNVEGAREKAMNGELLFGTVDTWLIWNLSGRKIHATDYSNASRTMLFDIKNLKWDEKILEILEIPASMLPTVKNSSEIYGYTEKNFLGDVAIPISGVAGDQQSALFGHCCFYEGMAKNTYGTGCFILMNTGDKMVVSKAGLITTIAWGIDGKVEYCLEGSIFMGGAVINWLKDELRLIDDAEESEYYGSKVGDTNGVYFVPAFVGLGAPYWDMYARGTIVGLSRGANRNHIVRAALESIAFQTKDVIKSMEKDLDTNIRLLMADGGATKNNLLMQFQADILGVEVKRSLTSEVTALGAAFLAGLSTGFWKDKSELLEKSFSSKSYFCEVTEKERDEKYYNWIKAVERSRNWENSIIK